MTPRRYRFVQVDVFTRQPFGGNQLAVFPEAVGLSEGEMQSIAAEMNYSESTFVFPPDQPTADARVRIFTPGMELPFAGHPVVGTGYVLGLERRAHGLTFELGVGALKVSAEPGNGRVGSARMEQPLPSFRPAEADPTTLAGMLGLVPDDIASNAPAEFGSAGVPFLYVPLRTLDAVRRARADAAFMSSFFAGRQHPAVYLFTLEAESPQAAAHARMLSLALGTEVREDPATGGASGPFGAYLVRHGLRPPGRLLLEQGYEMGRPSQIEVEIGLRDGKISQVTVGGGVVLMAEGHLLV